MPSERFNNLDEDILVRWGKEKPWVEVGIYPHDGPIGIEGEFFDSLWGLIDDPKVLDKLIKTLNRARKQAFNK